MCPVLCILPVILTLLSLYVVNRYFRRQRIEVGDKAVFITGCDRGFGETLSEKLAQAGYHVFSGCLDVNSDGARHLMTYSNVTVVECDVTSDKSVEDATKHLTKQLQDRGLWAVVNNAGVAVFAETEWCSMSAYERVLGVNLLGAIRVTKACLPLIRRAKGRVVNISSLAGRLALPGFTAYSASKFGQIGFSDALRREMKKFHVKVVSIEPKLYRTAISDSDFHVQTNQKLWGETAEIVRLDYGDTYFRAFLQRMLGNLQFSSRKTYMVIEDLLHAVTARYPYSRYVPGLKMQVLADMFVTHPNVLTDYFVNRNVGVKCVPFSMRQK